MIRTRVFARRAALSSAFALVAPAQERDRAKIDDKYKWNLADLYPSDDAWRAAKDKLPPEIAKLGAFKGTLGSSPARLADALDAVNRVGKELQKVCLYASLIADQDTRVSKYQGMQQEMQQLGAKFGETVAFVEPEILKIGKATLDNWIAQEPRLKTYKHYLDDIQRRRPHTLSDGEEQLLAAVVGRGRHRSSIYNILSNADFPYPTVTLSDGKSVKLDSSAFSLYRGVPNRADRAEGHGQPSSTRSGSYKGTFGSTLNGQVQANEFYAQRAGTTRRRSMRRSTAPNIPTTVYKRLVDGVNQGLPTFHRYLQLRKKMMNLPDLHYYDLYAPLVASADLSYTPEESQKNVLAALAPLGPEYVAAVRRAFNERWIDLLPNEGKKSGAYSNGAAYDVHPYMLINFNGKYTDMSTVAHELGHTMQSYLSNKAQPFHLANYPIFVAEVASTFNEALLIESHAEDDQGRQRQAVAARQLPREHQGHRLPPDPVRRVRAADPRDRREGRADHRRGARQAVSGDHAQVLRPRQGRLRRRGLHRPRVGVHPPLLLNFYVFQYATSFTASAALSEKVLAGDAAATKRYLAFLSAGGSKYPIELLKDAGVDMTTNEPLQLTLQKMNRVMDDMEKILAAKK